MEKFPLLKSEIDKINKNGESFLGFDGGNINSKIWFCGVEFGSSIQIMQDYYSEYVKYYKLDNFDIPFRLDCPNYFINSNFDRFLTYLYINLFQESPPENDVKNQIDRVLKNELYNKTSKSFKLNLFPIAKNDTSWDNLITEIFKINRQEYYNRMFEQRSKFVKKIISKFNPKLIICFSPKNYDNFFIDFFFNQDEKIQYYWNKILLNDSEFRLSIYESQHLKIIIVPFLGRGNINSYEKVKILADYLKNNVLQHRI